MEDFDAWRALLLAQHGIVTRRQALEHGLTLGMIRAHVAAERWRRLRYGVIATFTGPLTPEAAEWAAVLACWPAALSHESAGRRYRMVRPRAGAPTHVTVRYGASTSRHDDLVVHRSRAFDHITAPPDGGPPIVAPVHTAVDWRSPRRRHARRCRSCSAAPCPVVSRAPSSSPPWNSDDLRVIATRCTMPPC